MAMQQVEFEFPDTDTGNSIEVEGAVGREDMIRPGMGKKDAEDIQIIHEGETEVEVVDDTPQGDRNRKPSTPPEEITDDELAEYSEKVRKRIQHAHKAYHDERRAKEQMQRERTELERIARTLVQENQQLKGTVDKNKATLLEQAKRTVAAELDKAKKMYKDAYEAGDSDALLAAQEALITAKSRAEKVANFKLTALQQKQTDVQVPPVAPRAPAPAPTDDRAQAWAGENTWFGQDDEMTAFALGLDVKLKKDGVDPRSDKYYEHINTRMRQVFPDRFASAGTQKSGAKPTQKHSSSVVAPATRSTAPTKVRLTQTQVNIAKNLGLTVEQYARQVVKELRQNG